MDLQALLANPVLVGILGGAGVGAIFYRLSAVPQALWMALRRSFTSTVQIDNSDDLFDRLSVFLSRLPQSGNTRWLKMVEAWDDAERKWRWAASFGVGWHVFRHEGKFIFLNRSEAQVKDTFRKSETYTVMTLGRSSETLKSIMVSAENVFRASSSTRIYLWHDGQYILADQKPARSLDTIFLPEDQKKRIVSDLHNFSQSRDLYGKRGTPYRRGYLFYGPPGTGKTSLAMALAGISNRPIYMINLNTAGGDTGLISAFNKIEPGGAVLLEDIDSAKIAHDRDAADTTTVVNNADSTKVVSLTGLLNAIDGMAAREDRVLFMTSNHADKLDPALLRPGRVDCREQIDHLGDGVARQMSKAFLGEDYATWFDDNVANQLPISPAELQGLLLSESEARAAN